MTDVNISLGSIQQLADSIAKKLESSGNGQFAKTTRDRSPFADISDKRTLSQRADEIRVRGKSITALEAYNNRVAKAGLSMSAASEMFKSSSKVLNESMDSLVGETKNFEKIIIKNLNKQLESQSGMMNSIRVSSMEDVLAMQKVAGAAEKLSTALGSADANIVDESLKLVDVWQNLKDQGIYTFDSLFEEMLNITNSTESLEEKQQALAKMTQKLVEVQIKTAKSIDTSLDKHLFEPIKKHMGGVISKFFSFQAALTTATLAITNLYSDIMEMRRTGFAGGMTGMYKTAALMGVKPKDLIEANVANRQLIMNMGSSAQWSSRLVTLQKDYVKFIGDNTEAMKLASTTMDTFARSGLSANQSFEMVSNQSRETAEYMQRTLGVSGEMYASSLNSIMQDTNMRSQLIGATQAQRQEIIKGTLERMKERAQLGMTIDQMVAAEKAMRGLTGMSVKDRMKKAAQLRVMMGMYGIEGGAEAGAIALKGKRASPAELESLRRSTAQLSDVMSAQAVQGSLAGEAVAGVMTERFGMPELLGPGSVISTALNEGVSFQKTTAEGMGQVNATLSGVATTTQMILTNIGSNFAVQAALAALQFAGAAMLLRGASRLAMGGVGGGIGGGRGKGIGKMAGIAGSAAVSGLALGAMFGPWGALAGGLAGGAMDLYDMVSGPSQPSVGGMDREAEASQVTQNIEKTTTSMSELTAKTQELIEVNKQILAVAVAQMDQDKMSAEDRDRMFELGSRLGGSKSSFINPTG